MTNQYTGPPIHPGDVEIKRVKGGSNRLERPCVLQSAYRAA